jgi:REP element-mobilizing transposase RayT
MYFVTARAFQARMLLRPSAGLNQIIGGVLARATEIADVDVHAFVVASNHIHLLVTARGTNLSRFMQYFLSNTSKKVGRLVDWTGSLWQRRFAAEPVLDDDAAVDRLRYILSHGVKEGLVRQPSEWPGLSCLRLLLDGGSQTFLFFRWALRWASGKLRACGEDEWNESWAQKVSLTLAPLPSWAGLKQSERAELVQGLVADITQDWSHRGDQVAGREAVLAKSPHERPLHFKKSPRPLCHASSPGTRRQYLEHVRSWIAAFAEASERFRNGDWHVEFPPWAFLPMGVSLRPSSCARPPSFEGFAAH